MAAEQSDGPAAVAAAGGSKIGYSPEDSTRLAERITELPPELVEEAEGVLAAEKKIVPPFWVNKYEQEAARNWDKFYKRNTTNFFKDRHYLDQEWPDLQPTGERKVMVEVGCGVGNTAFPLLEIDPDIFIYATDFAPSAVSFVKEHELYDETRIWSGVCDISLGSLPREIVDNDGGADIATMIFVLSAITPEKFPASIRGVFNALKPGGVVLFRDYGRYDLAEVRFSKGGRSKLGDHFYVRQDGTRAYYFDLEELRELFEAEGFETDYVHYHHRTIVNRKKGLEMARVWIQGRFIKPVDAPAACVVEAGEGEAEAETEGAGGTPAVDESGEKRPGGEAGNAE